MINKKEIIAISVITFILAFTISLLKNWQMFFYSIIGVFLVIAINIIAKKSVGFYFDSEVEIRMWEIKKYGFKAHQNFKRPFPAGAFFPVIFTIFSLGNMTWMGSLVFDVKAKIHRAAKRHGLYSFSEMTESHIGFIAAAGILVNLIIAAISYFIGFQDFAKLNIYFAFFNMLPLSDLDGNKIFFGNLVLWSFLAAITLVAVGYAFLLV